MIKKLRKCADKSKTFVGLLRDLSKAFDCLAHDFIIANLTVCSFSSSASNLIHNYLSYRKQRIKINSPCSSWEETSFGVPQVSILGPLFFNTFVCGLLPVLSDVELSS